MRRYSISNRNALLNYVFLIRWRVRIDDQEFVERSVVNVALRQGLVKAGVGAGAE